MAASSQPKRIAVNSGYLLLAYIVEAVLSILLLSLVARYLLQAGFGRYGYVISFIEVFVMITEFSNSRVLVREVASDRANAVRHLADIWTMRLGLSIIMMAAVLLAAGSRLSDPEIWWSICLFALGQILVSLTEVFNAVFRAYEQMSYQAMTVVVGQVLVIGLCFTAIRLDLGLIGIFGARVVANLLRLVLAWHLSRRQFLPTRLSRNVRTMGHLLRESFPLGIILALRRLIWRGGLVMLTALLNREGAGLGHLAAGLLYGPLRLVEQMRIVPVSLVGSILPVFSQQARQEEERFRTTLVKSFKLVLTMSLLLAVVLTTLAGPITRIVLGSDLKDSAGVLAVLGWVVLFSFPNQFFEAALLAMGRQWVVTAGLTVGFAAGGLTSWLYFIPTHHALGVALGILLAEGIAFVVGLFALLPYFNLRQLAVTAFKILLSCVAAGGVFVGLGSLPILLVGPLGLLAFLAVLLLSRTFDREELSVAMAVLSFQGSMPGLRRLLARGSDGEGRTDA